MLKYLFSTIMTALVLIGCSDLERDNLLDPKNPVSYSDSPILIETFVNTNLDYNQDALDALDIIAEKYKEEVLIVEYHREIEVNNVPITDEYSQGIFTDLHDLYAETDPDYPKAIPDIYLNGSQGRILGASSSVSVAERIENIIPDLIDQKSNYKLEADIESSTDYLVINYKIARLGNESASGMKLYILLTKQVESNSKRTIVQYINFPLAENINEIDAGEYQEGNFTVDVSELEVNPDFAIFKITQNNDIRVLLTFKKEIEW